MVFLWFISSLVEVYDFPQVVRHDQFSNIEKHQRFLLTSTGDSRDSWDVKVWGLDASSLPSPRVPQWSPGLQQTSIWHQFWIRLECETTTGEGKAAKHFESILNTSWIRSQNRERCWGLKCKSKVFFNSFGSAIRDLFSNNRGEKLEIYK